jgi:ribosomal protein S1
LALVSAVSTAWKALETAQEQDRSVLADIQARVPKGLAVAIEGLNGLLPTGQVHGVRRSTPQPRVDILLREHLGQEIQVRLLRLDPDSGQIFVSERAAAGRQLPLF